MPKCWAVWSGTAGQMLYRNPICTPTRATASTVTQRPSRQHDALILLKQLLPRPHTFMSQRYCVLRLVAYRCARLPVKGGEGRVNGGGGMAASCGVHALPCAQPTLIASAHHNVCTSEGTHAHSKQPQG